MPRRILVLSASVGAGHLRAAEAVELALRQMLPDATVRNVDVLEMTNRLFKRVYGQFYLDLVNKAPHALGYFYDMLDQPQSPKQRRDRLSRPPLRGARTAPATGPPRRAFESDLPAAWPSSG